MIETWPSAPGGEDFPFFLEAVPGAYIRIGNGDSEALHHPAFDFSDDAIAIGVGLCRPRRGTWLTRLGSKRHNVAVSLTITSRSQ
ncbi:hypothetical protein [Rhizobium leguminosarum]